MNSEPEDFPFHTPAVELFLEDQVVQELNFIVEGCVFRGDIEIPTPPPSDSEQDDSRAPWEREDLPELDYDGHQAQWERDEVNGSNRKLADEPRYREPSPQPVRFIPSAAFTRSAVEERSNTPPDEFDRYLAESFRPVTKPLLPATSTPARDVAAPKAATTGAAITSRAGPSGDIVPRRLSYNDVSIIRRAHGERDPSRAAVSDDDYRFDDDPDLDPDDWQDQSCMMMIYCIMSMLPVVHATLLVVVQTLMRHPLVAHGLSLMISLLPVLVLRQVVILTSRRAVMLQMVSTSTVATSLYRLGAPTVVTMCAFQLLK
jgi:hypothetical protein